MLKVFLFFPLISSVLLLPLTHFGIYKAAKLVKHKLHTEALKKARTISVEVIPPPEPSVPQYPIPVHVPIYQHVYKEVIIKKEVPVPYSVPVEKLYYVPVEVSMPGLYPARKSSNYKA